MFDPEKQCIFCYKLFSKKSNLLKHLNICKKKTDISVDINIDTLNKNNLTCKYCNKVYSSTSYLNKHMATCKNKLFVIHNNHKEKLNSLKEIIQNNNVILDIEIKNITDKPTSEKNNSLECEYCHKTYCRKTLLNKHYAKCPEKLIKINQANESKIVELEEFINKNELKIITSVNKVSNKKSDNNNIKNSNNNVFYSNNVNDDIDDKQTTTINNQYNNNSNNIKIVNSDNNVINSNNTNITNNIIINNYGEEDLSYLSDDDLKEYIIDQSSGLLKCIKDIHFNPEHPENKNIRILNKKQPYLQVLKDNKWEFRIKKNELINILKNRYIYLEEHYNKVKDELTEEELKILDEYKKDYSYIFNLFAENEKKLELLIITNK